MIRAILISMTIVLSGCLVTRDQVREGVKPQPLTPEQQKRSEQVVKAQEEDQLLRELIGRVETLENSVGILSADKTGQRSEKENEKRSLEERLKIYEEAISKLEIQVSEIKQKLEQEKSSPAKSSSSESGVKNKSSYDSASDDYDNKRWKEAIVGFEKYRSLNKNGKRYSEATYKIGASFQELGMRSEAKAFYAEVIEKYPKSDWSTRAKSKLKSLK